MRLPENRCRMAELTDYFRRMQARSTWLFLSFLLAAGTAFPQTADSLKQQIRSAPLAKKIDLLLDLVDVLSRQKQTDSAMAYAGQCHQLGLSSGDKRLLALGLDALGTVYIARENWEQASAEYFEALRLAEAISDTALMASYSYQVGYIYNGLRNQEQSRKYLSSAASLYERLHDLHMQAETYNMLGSSYKETGEYDKALDYHQKALRLREQTGDKKGIAYSLNNIALVYRRTKAYDKALVYLKKSLEIKTELGDKKGMAGSYINISTVYLVMKDYKGAIPYVERGIALADSVHAVDFLMNGMRNAAECYYYADDYEPAAFYYNKFLRLYDSAYQANNTRQIAEMQTKYETEKQQREIELQSAKLSSQESDIRRQKAVNYAIVLGLCLALALIGVVFRSYRQNKKANAVLAEKNQLIEEKNKDITDSIHYAKRLQQAILPSAEFIRGQLADAFVLFQPKDIVSGDLYFVERCGPRIIVAAVDCTGHGVPGAFMSMLAHNLLHQAVVEMKISTPGLILDHLNTHLAARLNRQQTDTIRDGMDVSLCSIDPSAMTLEFAGANNPLWLIRNNELSETKGNKFPVGWYDQSGSVFTTHAISLQKNDRIYLFSDGYADQFGGEKGKKMMTRNFKTLLTGLGELSMPTQAKKIERHLHEWKGALEQVDDVLVIGIRV
jgi:serine phosphatase RsbU (regulator of sigma subunit)/lipopolysaccharide biosynthesis regulator YciM